MRTHVARLGAIAIALVIAVIGPATADPVKIGTLEIDAAWTRATPPKSMAGGGYMKISNRGSTGDKLIAVSSPAAKKSAVHNMSIINEIMKMAPVVGGLELAPGQMVELKPGGLHIMFMGLIRPFTQGATIPVTLTFEKAGTIDVMLQVGAIGARALKPMKHTN
jgi:copper(I)-binding protein